MRLFNECNGLNGLINGKRQEFAKVQINYSRC